MDIVQAEKLALKLMREHDLVSWNFRFDRAKVRFGCCNYTHKIISLSRHLTQLNTSEIVRNTILHEIAHALVGNSHGHGKAWREKALEIGADPTRCYHADEVVLPKRNYTVRCVHCKREHQAIKKRWGTACGDCCTQYNGGRYSREFRLEYEKN